MLSTPVQGASLAAQQPGRGRARGGVCRATIDDPDMQELVKQLEAMVGAVLWCCLLLGGCSALVLPPVG